MDQGTKIDMIITDAVDDHSSYCSSSESLLSSESQDTSTCICETYARSDDESDILPGIPVDRNLLYSLFSGSFIKTIEDAQSKVRKALPDDPTSTNPCTIAPTELECLEQELKRALDSVDLSFSILSHARGVIKKALSRVQYSRSAISSIPFEVWSTIFALSLAPFDTVGGDYGHLLPSTNVSSFSGQRFCSPETILLVCKRWNLIALDSPRLWTNISKSHVVFPLSRASFNREARVRLLASKWVNNAFVERLLRFPKTKDRLVQRASAFAIRSKNLPLLVDLRCAQKPQVIFKNLQPHFGRFEVLFLDRWDHATATALHTVDVDNPDPQFPIFGALKTLSLTAPREVNTYRRDEDRPVMFPIIFNEAPHLINLRIGPQFDLDDLSFLSVPWSQLQVLELQGLSDQFDVLKVLRECSSLVDLIVSCPDFGTQGVWPTSLLWDSVKVSLPKLKTLHYQCHAEFDSKLRLPIQLLDTPKLEVLSLDADVSDEENSWLESRRAEQRLLTKIFCGSWPRFTTLELLHLNQVGLKIAKNSMEEFLANMDIKLRQQNRTVTLGGAVTSNSHEERFDLCITGGVGGPERLNVEAARLNDTHYASSKWTSGEVNRLITQS